MGRARSAIAVRASVDALRAAAVKAFGMKVTDDASVTDFDDAIDFCRPRSEELGADEGLEAWYFWTQGEWAIVGDLSLGLIRDDEALEKLSSEVGDIVACGIDAGFEFASFAAYSGGQLKRLLVLEDDEIIEEGFPVEAERGSFIEDFNEEEAERLWTSYGLPTFDYDPLEGPFQCVGMSRG